MNPASGPDYLRMEKFNPRPKCSPLVGIWRLAEYPNLARRVPHPVYGKNRTGCFGGISVTEKELIETEIARSMMASRIVAPPVSKYWSVPVPRVKQEVVIPVPKPAMATCEICGEKHPSTAVVNKQALIQRHHTKPVSQHQRLKKKGILTGLHHRVWLCFECHKTLHQRFTNVFLADTDWQEVRFLMRNTCAPPSVVP